MQIKLQQAKIKITSELWLHIDHFTIEEKTFNVIVGHNGSGKSTLSKFISQHQPPYEGHYQNTFEKISLVSLAQQQVLLEQIFRDLNNDSVSPDDHGKTAKQIICTDKQYSDQQIAETAALIGIQPLLDRAFKLLSTGEARKVLLAKALIEQPDLLILDEPFEGLDANSQQQWLQLLQQLKQNITIVLVINRLTDVPVWADTISLLHQCRLLIQDQADQILESDAFQQLCYAETSLHVPVPLPAFPTVTLSQDLQTIFDLEDVTVKYGVDILPVLKVRDSYQCLFQTIGYSRWVLVADLSMKFTSQALRACPALTFYYSWTIARPHAKTFIAPTTSAFSV